MLLLEVNDGLERSVLRDFQAAYERGHDETREPSQRGSGSIRIEADRARMISDSLADRGHAENAHCGFEAARSIWRRNEGCGDV